MTFEMSTFHSPFLEQFQRRERLASETLKRRERHARAMEDVAREAEAWESESRRSLGQKMGKAERIISERERSRKRSREHASKMAEIREAIRSVGATV